MALKGDDIRSDSYLLCRAGGHLCAMPIDRIIETMRVLPIETLSSTAGFVRGMSLIRGAPVPVVELARLFDTSETLPQRLVTINVGTGIVALLVDAVLGIRLIAADSIKALPPVLRDAAGETVSAIGILDAELLLFLGDLRLISESATTAPHVEEPVA